jgi:hypothetical protein
LPAAAKAAPTKPKQTAPPPIRRVPLGALSIIATQQTVSRWQCRVDALRILTSYDKSPKTAERLERAETWLFAETKLLA